MVRRRGADLQPIRCWSRARRTRSRRSPSSTSCRSWTRARRVATSASSAAVGLPAWDTTRARTSCAFYDSLLRWTPARAGASRVSGLDGRDDHDRGRAGPLVGDAGRGPARPVADDRHRPRSRPARAGRGRGTGTWPPSRRRSAGSTGATSIRSTSAPGCTRETVQPGAGDLRRHWPSGCSPAYGGLVTGTAGDRRYAADRRQLQPRAVPQRSRRR